MFYSDHQKDKILEMFEQIMPDDERERIRTELADCTLEQLRAIALNNMERIVCTKLLNLGIQPHMQGYKFLAEAICHTIEDSTYTQNMSDNCYGALAEKYGKSPSSIERSIRLCIDNAWKNHSDVRAITQTTTRPTNREFITIVAEQLRLSYL